MKIIFFLLNIVLAKSLSKNKIYKTKNKKLKI